MPKKIEIKGPIVSNNVAWLYRYLGWDAASPNVLKKGLEDAAGEDVILEINSPGGVCVYGYEMYTAIMEYTGKVTCNVICAMSAATLLVCAADEALISDTGIFMIHNARSEASGDYRRMEEEADTLKEFNAGIINAYVRKTGKNRDEIQTLMDSNSYMSPKKAIELGFIDGYMFGNPNEDDSKRQSATNIVASEIQIMSEEKAKELINLIKNAEVAPVQPNNKDSGIVADPNKSDNVKGEKKNMNLKELLESNPEAKAEFDQQMKEAAESSKAAGVEEERARMKSLDAISVAVSAKALNDAKYGENPICGQELAYQAMVNGDRIAQAYLNDAREDSEDSNAQQVGMGKPDAGEQVEDEADELAGYINSKMGGE